MNTVGIANMRSGHGYCLASSDGGVLPLGDAVSFGSMKGQALNKPVVGMAATPTGKGYWLTAGDGGVFSFGDADFWGSITALNLNKPVVGMAATPTGKGYWLTAGDGGVFSFGDADFWGSMASHPLNKPVVGIASTLDGQGYWLAAGDGGVFSFGNAVFHGSMPPLPLNKPVVGIAATPSGNGYWLVAGDGGIFTFGDAGFYGSLGSQTLDSPVVGMTPTPSGKGYWLAAGDGRTYAFGDATFASLVITESMLPPTESCGHVIAAVTGSFDPPAALINCQNDPFCGRLVPELGVAARTKDAKTILTAAAFQQYLSSHPGVSPDAQPSGMATALADLAVTGREAYGTFRQQALTETDLVAPVTTQLQTTFPAHSPVAADVGTAVRAMLKRAHAVAWALRGPVDHRRATRGGLGWIAVDGEDDPPHRPVNVPSALYPQYDITVQVGTIPVASRYFVASRHITDNFPVTVDQIPPVSGIPSIVGDVILFIHGHSSSAEEAMPLIGPLLQQAADRDRPVTLVAMDLPSNGYASMLEHTTIAPLATSPSLWNSGYPILDFIENFIVAFVDQLEVQQPGIKTQIIGVIGGSLGGNMTLRLARRDPTVHPWLHSVVSWSPASTWPSWARAVLGFAPVGRFTSLLKHEGVGRTWGSMQEAEVLTPHFTSSLNKFFYQQFAGQGVGRIAQADHWYSPSWPCREAAKQGSHRAVYEIYNPAFRRWHWRVAHEQLIYSHWDSDDTSTAVDPDPRLNANASPARYAQIKSRLLLATGHDDDESPETIFRETRALATAMTMVDGSTLFLKGTGHAIPTERPIFFAGQILDFLFKTPFVQAGPRTVWIHQIDFNPPGRDVDREYVAIQNDTSAPIAMGSWTLRDVANHVFTFPSFVLAPGLQVRVWTAAGANDAENLFWGRQAAIWNNTGDTAILRDQQGMDVANYSY